MITGVRDFSILAADETRGFAPTPPREPIGPLPALDLQRHCPLPVRSAHVPARPHLDGNRRKPLLSAAQPSQPPRPHRRRIRHRQDRHPQGDGRGLLQGRRARLPGRRQGRRLGHVPARQGHRKDAGTHRALWHRGLELRGLSLQAVEHTRGPGPARAHHGERHGPNVAGAPAGPHRGAGGRAQHRLSRGRRPAAPPHRPQGPALHAQLRGRALQRDRDQLRQGRKLVCGRHPARPHRRRGPGWRALLRRARSTA